ncbi:MAG: M17 family peptidase N-terminal domain-containing protein [Sandaracinus sp.]
MELRFATPDTRRLDELRADALVLPFFAEERPMRGAAGLIDYRLRGQLSRLRIRGRLSGDPRERVLVPGKPLTSFDKIFLVGLGAEAAMTPASAELACRSIVAMLDACLARSVAMVLPGRSTGRLEPEVALEALIRASLGEHEQDTVTVIEEAEAHRALTLTVERERRKARAAAAG